MVARTYLLLNYFAWPGFSTRLCRVMSVLPARNLIILKQPSFLQLQFSSSTHCQVIRSLFIGFKSRKEPRPSSGAYRGRVACAERILIVDLKNVLPLRTCEARHWCSPPYHEAICPSYHGHMPPWLLKNIRSPLPSQRRNTFNKLYLHCQK